MVGWSAVPGEFYLNEFHNNIMFYWNFFQITRIILATINDAIIIGDHQRVDYPVCTAGDSFRYHNRLD